MLGAAQLKTVQKCWQGLHYLKKEVLQDVSIKSGGTWVTPTSYYIMCTLRCNFKCTYCPQTPDRKGDAVQLSRETMLRIVRESKELSGKGYNISVSGGEPLVYKPIYEALELAHKLGVDFGLTTNAYLLTTEAIKRIVGADPFNINISLEAVDPAVNEKMRPTPGATKRVLSALDALLAEKERVGARFGVFIKPTVTEVNYRSLPETVRYFGKGGKVQVNPQSFYMVPGGEHFWIKDPDNLAAVVEELIALREEGYCVVPAPETLRGMVDYFRSPPKPAMEVTKTAAEKACRVGFRNLAINPDGRAFFCEAMGSIGNITDTSLRDLWYGPEAERQRRAALGCLVDCQMACLRPVSVFTRARAFLRMG